MGLPFAIVLAAGVLVMIWSWVAVRAAGAHPGKARRLAGPREVKVGRVAGGVTTRPRPVRVAGRIRCRDPLDMGDGERLVAFHRDVEARIGGAWRSVERLRETRSFDLWDHDGSLVIDPAGAAEPLIVIPSVWRGEPSDLEEPHRSAVARLSERHGAATEARAVTRTINVTDRLLVTARAQVGEAGRVRLEPPDGGYLITNLALDDAMRLLGGTNRRLASGGVIGVAVGTVLVGVGGIGSLLAAVLPG